MKRKYTGIIEDYLNALDSGNFERIVNLFHRDAKIFSPLYGEREVHQFYKDLFADSNDSRIRIGRVYENSEDKSAVVLFQYEWELASGKTVEFDCVDIFEFDETSKISSMRIIYDTWPVRDEFEKLKTN